MVAIVIAFPGLVTSGLGDLKPVDIDKIQIEIPQSESQDIDPSRGFGAPAPAEKAPEAEDPNAAILRAIEREGKK
jgi:hypothetical protein